MQMAQEIAAGFGRRGEEVLQDRELRQRTAERDQFARRREAQSDAARKAFQVENAAEFLADFAADNRLLDELRDRVQPRVDGFALDQRTQNPGAEQTCAHSGDGYVERGEECGWPAAARFVAEDGTDEFKIADRHRVENERVVLLVVTNAVEVAESVEAGGFVDGWR